MPIKFTKPYTTKEGDQSRTFEEGEVVDFAQEYADAEGELDSSVPPEEVKRRVAQRAAASEQHFISRGVAVREGDEDQPRLAARKQRLAKAEGKAADEGKGEPAQQRQAPAAPARAEPAGQPHVLPRGEQGEAKKPGK